MSRLKKAGRAICLVLLLARAVLPAVSKTVWIPSPAMGNRFRATVILPDTYKSSGKRYPVIYFLHGYSQNHAVWPKVAPLEKYADRYQVLMVCPDGNHNSWYFDSPALPGFRFETYIAGEVPAYIDSVFRTIASYRCRALIGSSMGGHGALYLLFKHPDRFAAASSISGILDLTRFPGKWGIAKVLGPYDRNKPLWRSHSIAGLADSITVEDRGIFIDCGMSDPALVSNRQVHTALAARSMPHHYREAPGGHTPRYVRNAVEYHILFAIRILHGSTR
ncbi:MAG: alpha/beta fold hydrolase [Chitinivibrionales bacterium]|nr:alpha/beta fold hydrolase [Chitinivibrionales bacterium]MBD3396016.1 alpha/beta fold hydrolase [Chitinivibrionales bacterium]